MAVAFTKGDSLRSTRNVTKPAVNPEGNSMKGLRGFIKTGQDTSSGGLKGKAGIGPKRPGPIGQKGGASPKAHFTAAKSRGSADKSYKATSTGPAGKVVSNGKMEALKGRARFSSEK